MRTFSNDLGQGTLNNITNLGFDPAGKFLVEGNDTIKVESFDSLRDVVIKDPSVSDLDVMTIALSDKTTNEFRATMENIETLHVDVSGAFNNTVTFTPVVDEETGQVTSKVSGLKTLEFAGSTNGTVTVNAYGSNLPNGVTKIDASGLTVGNVNFDARYTDVTTLIGGAYNDTLTIGTNGGTLTGGQGADAFVVSNAVNKLVTITDIASKDTIILGNNVKTTADAKELIITGASDETTFVAALQKEADTQAGNGLYYATFNGDTYVIANGAVGGQTVKSQIFNFAGIGTASGSASASISAGVKNGSITLKDLDGLSAKSVQIMSTGTISANTIKLASANSAALHFDDTAITQGVTSVTLTPDKNGIKVTGVVDDGGKEYKLSDFEAYHLYASESATSTTSSITGGSGTTVKITGTLSNINVSANSSKFSGANFDITGTVNLTGGASGAYFEGVIAGDGKALNDDIIVKLSGTHNIPTEADVSIDNLGIASLNFV